MTKAQARAKVKRHLRKYGDNNDFIITERLLGYWWTIINLAVFDNKLPKPIALKAKKLQDAYGECIHYTSYGSNVRIVIDERIEDRETLIAVLVHEMVHSYEQVVHGKMSHGKNFYIWGDRIEKKIGVPLTQWV